MKFVDNISSKVLSILGLLIWSFILYSNIFNPSIIVPIEGFILMMVLFLVGGVILGSLIQRALNNDL